MSTANIAFGIVLLARLLLLLLLLLRVDLAEEVERLGVLGPVLLEAAQPVLDAPAVIGLDGHPGPGLGGPSARRAVELGLRVLAAGGDQEEQSGDRGQALHPCNPARPEPT